MGKIPLLAVARELCILYLKKHIRNEYPHVQLCLIARIFKEKYNLHRKSDFAMAQRTKEWIEGRNIDYHERQYHEVYRSTVHFYNWLMARGCLETIDKFSVLDIGAGQGANIFFMAKSYPNIKFDGIDINKELVDKGNSVFRKFSQNNCRLFRGDLYRMPKDLIGKYKGIVSFQTLSWLPEFKEALISFTKLKPDWIALSSLFYDGKVNCKIQIEDYTVQLGDGTKIDYFYNVYSLPLVEELFRDCGYADFEYIPFEIDIDIPKPVTKGMGTYTERLENGNRIQLSGPIMMPWYFVLARQ